MSPCIKTHILCLACISPARLKYASGESQCVFPSYRIDFPAKTWQGRGGRRDFWKIQGAHMMQPRCILAERRLPVSSLEGAASGWLQMSPGCIHSLKTFPGSDRCPARAPGFALLVLQSHMHASGRITWILEAKATVRFPFFLLL